MGFALINVSPESNTVHRIKHWCRTSGIMYMYMCAPTYSVVYLMTMLVTVKYVESYDLMRVKSWVRKDVEGGGHSIA